jgi:uncharacterized YccA/Bax inhibitor family protein
MSATLVTGANPFVLNTGTTFINFSIAIPATHTLDQVIDTDAFNLDITDQFIKAGQPTSVNVTNGWGGTDLYYVWTMTNATPYSPRHRFNCYFT